MDGEKKNTHSCKKWAIDSEKSFSANRYIQIIDLRQQFLFRNVQLAIIACPECEFFNISNEFQFL